MSVMSRSPFLQKRLRSLVSKLLDFSELPKVKSQARFMFADIEILMFERELLHSFSDFKIQDIKALAEINNILAGVSNIETDFIRLGSKNDGGYVIPKSARSGLTWITFGIGNNCDFENDLSENNRVICFDHTIHGLPYGAENSISFHRLGLSIIDSPDFCNLDKALEIASLGNDDSWCLKIDIEGDEWGILHTIPLLKNPPKVLVIEFHHLLKSLKSGTSRDLLEKLTNLSTHYVSIFSNVNNFGAVLKTDFGVFADTVEVTMVQSDSAVFSLNESAIKIGELRSPNNPNRHTLQLK